MVSYWCFEPQDTGGICDWVSSQSGGSCGEAGTYVIDKKITIPEEAGQLEERFGSLLTIRVNAIIGGDEECGANYSSYGSAASFAGAALLVGLALHRRQRYVGGVDADSKVYVEMSDASASPLPA